MAHQRNKSRPTAPTSESPAVTTSAKTIRQGTNFRQTTPATSSKQNKERDFSQIRLMPNICLPTSLHLPPIKEKSTSSLSNRNVDDTVVQLQARIFELQKDNQKLQSQNAALSGELDKLHQENKALIFINGKFRKEQDKLYEELKRNRSFRLPRTLQSTARTVEKSETSPMGEIQDYENDDKYRDYYDGDPYGKYEENY
ncbi:13756_t:CDS:2 [Funneliformis caledonium]|uniref:13756_t:CDS:1 n=1 Tax=Funneliformis caledonium TaxID=1117310 RepID=A0A9N9E9A7_9GLOM|nr:13756_t:CDS:2 [Funneliformis caledonium]